MATVALNVVHIATGEVVETLDVSKQSERGVEQILSGLLHQMNTDDYCVEEVEE